MAAGWSWAHSEPVSDLKQSLHRHLRHQSDALLLKLDGLPERELRLPRTPTGTSLLGIVDLYRRVQAFADETITTLELDSPGRVAWWGPG